MKYTKMVSREEANKILINILADFDCFCRQKGLHYSLAGGTLIGAFRHKGFIPWDDDIDVFMPRPDYNQFLKCFDSSNYKLITSGKHSDWTDAYSILTDKNTIVYFDDRTYYHGLWLDILPIDGYPGDKIWKKSLKQLYFWSSVGRLKRSTWLDYLSPMRNIMKTCGRLLLKPIPQYFVAKRIESYIKKYPIGTTKELGNNSTYMLLKLKDRIPHHFDNSCMDDYIEVEFEGLKVMAMAGYDKYLTKVFGDWRQLPPEDQRVTHRYKAYYIDN